MSTIQIANRTIGPGHPVFVVAEMGGNHAQSFETAKRLVLAAHEAGADAVKSQCFRPCSMTLKSEAEPFMIDWQGCHRSLWSLYSETAIPMEWHKPLKDLAESLGMVYFASVFSRESLDFMDALGVPAFKIASFELTDLPLIRYAAGKGKPLILSTGMATQNEIYSAIGAVQKASPSQETELALLKCVSAYPASAGDTNLVMMQHWIREWGWVAGLSDHTLGIAVPVAAVALGACIIEKHLTLSRADGGPDAAFSLEPQEFRVMVDAVRVAEQAIGEVRYGSTEAEKPMLRLRRSLWLVANVKQGESFTPDKVRSLRPAVGIEPKDYDEIIGKRAAKDCRAGEALTWAMFSQ